MNIKMTCSDLFLFIDELEKQLSTELSYKERIEKEALLKFIKTELLGD